MIKLRNIGKKFHDYSNPIERFKEFFIPGKRDQFWALKNINLDIGRGQTVAIIGPNGSGKSTLLQVIAGILHPSHGDIQVNGKVSALLELGAGFNPDFTGKENVYLNASILGMSQGEIDKKFNDIVSFSGIGEFISKPVKTYSSGMFVRLAFATAINVDPDILIIDEALAVGDVAFQQRCMTKIKQLQSEGKTIIFVSHDTSAVKSLCDHAVLMHHGEIIEQGNPELMVNKYLKLVYQETLSGVSEEEEKVWSHQRKDADIKMVTVIPNIDNRFGNEMAKIIGVGIFDNQDNAITVVDSSDQKVNVKISVKYMAQVDNPIIGFVMRDRLGNDITATNTYLEGIKIDKGDKNMIQTILFEIHVPELLKGHYSISPAIANGSLSNHDMCDWIDNAITFEVTNSRLVYGMMRLPTEISYSTFKG
ncbi:ABC transporter ATP-binding protein [Brevibacillus migulae]|uniref:ABC transporter ATP-binding protein n=1 Tax=Brevibacillus migulae TaxID=1644114 RepID=UPI001431B51E|nr:ABC transporter ATP-binding protein [Brevibacillus migulae]